MQNYSKKSTYPLFESVCVQDGEIKQAYFHQKRFEDSFFTWFGRWPSYGLFDDITIPEEQKYRKVKLRIAYGLTSKQHEFFPYVQKKIKTLRLVEGQNINYHLKFEDRTPLHHLYQSRKDCDDVLIVKNGLITDTSYANIIFFDGENWHTPHIPLLKGTKREALINDGRILSSKVNLESLQRFKGFQLINAMLDFENLKLEPMANLIL